MSNWHHHHEGATRIVFCRVIPEPAEHEGCNPEYDGWICDKSACVYHLAIGRYVVDESEQLALVTHLESIEGAPELRTLLDALDEEIA